MMHEAVKCMHLTMACSSYCMLCYQSLIHAPRYAEFLVAPKCRFCDMPVTDRNRMKHPASDAVRQVMCIDELRHSTALVFSLMLRIYVLV